MNQFRKKSEGRSSKRSTRRLVISFGFRDSGFFRNSVFEFRILNRGPFVAPAADY